SCSCRPASGCPSRPARSGRSSRATRRASSIGPLRAAPAPGPARAARWSRAAARERSAGGGPASRRTGERVRAPTRVASDLRGRAERGRAIAALRRRCHNGAAVEGGDGTERDSAARWRLRAGRTAAVAALLAWCVLLVLSAWPERVFLTGLLGVPAQLADALLGRLAMTGGISVFDPPRRRIERVNLADCVFVRARDAHGAETSLHPPGGECQTGGLRLAIPRLEWVQRDLILRSTAP